MALYDITEYGAVGDGKTLDTEAVQRAIDTCTGDGGGTVFVPAGKTFLIGSIELKENVELHVERGGELLGTDDIEKYTGHAFPYAKDPERRGWALITATKANSIAITGGGKINGNGKKFMEELDRYIYKGKKQRPQLFTFSDCNNVTFREIELVDSANWCINLSGCEDVLITGIRIMNDLALPNCDGIDPDHCRNVRISDCYIQSGDDCIVIKNREEHPEGGPSENITVTNCVLCSTSTAVKIGTESIDDFRNITFQNCVIKSSNRGLSIQLRDYGNVENILFSNCIIETRYFNPKWWGRSEPIYVTAIHRAPGTKLGKVRNVRFSNCLCRCENGVFLAGSEDSMLEDIVLDNVRIEVDKWSKWPGRQHDRRPCMVNDTSFGIDPEFDKGIVGHDTVGVFGEHIDGLTLRNVQVTWGENQQEYWSHALETHNVQDLKQDGFEGQAGREGVEPQKID
ncbi:MAG: glycoside hydrolase family 28 protein [Phycisphaerae bacterium]